MVQAYGPAGLKQYDKAVTAMEVVIDSRKESANLYAQLAILAAGAKQDRKATLAEAKAIALAPKKDRKQLKSADRPPEEPAQRPAAGPASERLTRTRRYHGRRAPVAQLAEQRTLIRRFKVRFLAGACEQRRSEGLSFVSLGMNSPRRVPDVSQALPDEACASGQRREIPQRRGSQPGPPNAQREPPAVPTGAVR